MNQLSKLFLYSFIALCCVALLCCGEKDAAEKKKNGMIKEPIENAVAGIVWSYPSRWSKEHERPMRAVTYSIPQVQGDSEPVECAVFYFGNQQGGNVESNIERWASQFETTMKPERSTKIVNGMTVVLVRINGTYLAPIGPMMESSGRKENYSLRAAIVGAPNGNVFFKMVGPAKSVVAAGDEFDSLIDSIEKLPNTI